MNSAETPSKPRPTTVNPITAPDRKATVSAPVRPFLAASVVLTALMVAVFMPIQPATPLASAPTT